MKLQNNHPIKWNWIETGDLKMYGFAVELLSKLDVKRGTENKESCSFHGQKMFIRILLTLGWMHLYIKVKHTGLLFAYLLL